jgi:hypothetical protein
LALAKRKLRLVSESCHDFEAFGMGAQAAMKSHPQEMRGNSQFAQRRFVVRCEDLCQWKPNACQEEK